MTKKQACSSLAINITGSYTNLQVGSTTNIACQTNPIIPNTNLTFTLQMLL